MQRLSGELCGHAGQHCLVGYGMQQPCCYGPLIALREASSNLVKQRIKPLERTEGQALQR